MGTDDADALPDSFEEFINGETDVTEDDLSPPSPATLESYRITDDGWTTLNRETLGALNHIQDALTDRATDQVEQLSSAYHDQDPLAFRDPDAVVLEYTTIFTVAKKELWEHPDTDEAEGWQDVIALIGYAARDDTPDVDIYMPEDAEAILDGHIDVREIAPVLDDLEALTESLPVAPWIRQGNVHNTLMTAINQELQDAAVAAYNGAYNRSVSDGGMEEFTDLPAGTPAAILDGLKLGGGQFDYPQLNRVANAADYIDWTDRTSYDGELPDALDAPDITVADVDAVVLDHCVVMDAVLDRTWTDGNGTVVYDGGDVFQFLNDVFNYSVDERDLPVYMLDNQEAYLTPLMADTHAAAITDELGTVTGTLSIDDTIAADGYEQMAEDYRITQSADEQIDGEPLFVTADADYDAIDDLYATHVGDAAALLDGR